MAATEQGLIGKRPHAKNGVRIKTVALPAEHGAWGLLFEPIVLALLLATSIAGVYLALSAVGLFLARHPLTLLALNRRRLSPRTRLAKQFAAFYLIVAGLTLLEALRSAQYSFALPLLVAAPMALWHFVHDCTGRRRVLLPEAAGAVAISSIAPAIAMADGWSTAGAFSLWAIMISRAVPAIFYVRACLAKGHGRATSLGPTMLAHLIAVAGMAGLVAAGLAPRLVIIAVSVLLARAVIGSVKASHLTVRQLGFSEVGFGAAVVLAVLFGHAFGL